MVKSILHTPETTDRDHKCSIRCFVGGTDGAGGWRGRGGVAANGRSIATVNFAGKQEVADEASRKEWKNSPKIDLPLVHPSLRDKGCCGCGRRSWRGFVDVDDVGGRRCDTRTWEPMWMRCDHGNNNIIGLVRDGKVPGSRRWPRPAILLRPKGFSWLGLVYLQAASAWH